MAMPHQQPTALRAQRPQHGAANQPANQIGLFKPDVDLIMKVNSLEQQLGRSQDEAKLLRRQLNESTGGSKRNNRGTAV